MEQAYLIASIVSACISVTAAVIAAWFIRRGTDADLKADVGELSQFVEKLAKESRRERMRRVRAGQKESPEGPEAVPAPPGLEGLIGGAPEAATPKDELRRRVFAARRQS